MAISFAKSRSSQGSINKRSSHKVVTSSIDCQILSISTPSAANMLATKFASKAMQPARTLRAVQPLARSLETKPMLSALRFQPAIRQLHMRPTQMLKMRQTGRMMRPVPVSFMFSPAVPKGYRWLTGTTEGGAQWYVLSKTR